MSKVTDPVCGMQIEPEEAAGKLEYQGQTYYFCGEGCEKAFRAEPSKYATPAHQDQGHHH
ncbi:MAG: YHS domain-containing protein [Meiothermus sp.]|nr:YHS domain-containing protein [Meiothermus sp.]